MIFFEKKWRMLRWKWMPNLNIRDILERCYSFFRAIFGMFSFKVPKSASKGKRCFPSKFQSGKKKYRICTDFNLLKCTKKALPKEVKSKYITLTTAIKVENPFFSFLFLVWWTILQHCQRI
jgi:hypothetical protein